MCPRLQPDNELSSILAGIKHCDGCGRCLNALQDVLPILEASFSNPAGERSYSLLVPWCEVGRQKPLHDRAFDKQMPLRARPFIPWIPTRVGRRTTDRYSRAQIDPAKDSVVDRTRRVVEECIDPVWAALCQRLVTILRRLAVYGGILAEIFDTLSNLVGSAGEPDRNT